MTPQIEVSFLKMIPIVQQKHMLGVSFTAGDETPARIVIHGKSSIFSIQYTYIYCDIKFVLNHNNNNPHTKRLGVDKII